MSFRINRIWVSALLLVFGCSQKPALELEGFESRIVTIAYLKSLYNGNPYIIQDNICITGRVVANDKFRNFHKTLVIDDETGGIEVKLDREELHIDFQTEDKVEVYCNSLVLGSYGGSLQLGIRSSGSNYETEPVPATRINSTVKVVRSEDGEILPHSITLDQLQDPAMGRFMNCYVSIDRVQFADSELGCAWSEPDADTNRLLVDEHGNSIDVRTSRYASFATEVLPGQSGTIRAILGYFNGKYQLKIYDPRSLSMTEARF